MLKKQYGIWIFKRAQKQAFGLGRIRRIHHLQSGDTGKPSFRRLAMKRSGNHACARRHANHQISLLAPAVVKFCRLVADLGHGLRHKIAELHFNHGLKALDRKPYARTYDRRFTQRRVANSVCSVAIHEAFCGLKYPAVFGDILTHEYQIFVAFQGLI